MSKPGDPDATELGWTPPKRSVRSTIHRSGPDVFDFLDMAELAERIAKGSMRDATDLSLNEIRALARLAFAASLVAMWSKAAQDAASEATKRTARSDLAEAHARFLSRFRGEGRP